MELQEEETVRKRVRSSKALRLVPWGGSSQGKSDEVFAERLAQEALARAGTQAAVVVFVNTVTLLDRIYNLLVKSVPEDHCLRFNGQIRGYERDQAFSEKPGQGNAVYQIFRTPRCDRVPRDYPVFLLATSAGEVGVNFDADHAVCDLVSLERMAQRLGRVNRAGDGAARITVFLPADLSKAEDQHLQKTAQLLAKLPGLSNTPGLGQYSASPEDLGRIFKEPEALQAYMPASEPPPLDPSRLDDWSLTSLHSQDYARPQVSYWLRGITPDDDQAVTRLAWREELRYADGREDAFDMATMRPPVPREILQLPTYRAVKWLLARTKKHLGVRVTQADPYHGDYAVILTTAGKWETWAFSDLEDREKVERLIKGATVLLPTTIGGLKKGLLDETVEDKAVDVFEKSSGTQDPSARAYRRVLLQASAEEGWESFDLSTEPTPKQLASAGSYLAILRETAGRLKDQTGQTYRRLARKRGPAMLAEENEDNPSVSAGYWVEYFASTRAEVNTADDADEPSLRGQTVALQAHLDQAEACAGRITARLHLPPLITEAVVFAAKWHDLGKDREHWQRAVGNPNPAEPWAKSDRAYFDRRETRGYRHEFGSLMDTLAREELTHHPERDLVLHLIAAHHGHGRPGFGEEAYDVPRYLHRQCVAAAVEAELRFDRLQRRFGWWGLAYLEALVKCADALASEAADPPRPAAPSPTEPPSRP